MDLGMACVIPAEGTFFDDGASLILDEEGWVHPRKKGCIDTYFFGYGRDILRRFTIFISSPGQYPFCPGMLWATVEPLLEIYGGELRGPFDALYRDEYSILCGGHGYGLAIVDIPEKYGKGGTGYTWNKDFSRIRPGSLPGSMNTTIGLP